MLTYNGYTICLRTLKSISRTNYHRSCTCKTCIRCLTMAKHVKDIQIDGLQVRVI